MEIGQITRYRKGEAIIREAAPAFNVYIINKGHAQVLKRYGEREVTIGSLGEGDVFGEMAFIGETERTATVVASSDMEVQRISQKDFSQSINTLPVEAASFFKALVNLVKDITEVQSKLSFCNEEMKEMNRKLKNPFFKKGLLSTPQNMQLILFTLLRRLRTTYANILKMEQDITKNVEVMGVMEGQETL
ncbi:MAG: cyclic nucleotide-binding domain-containing protein [Candidatus Brocadiales bacterium]|nr:cyclic nucleotide-binding domain-containing protein [Candidatus Brocadiales bacterium]